MIGNADTTRSPPNAEVLTVSVSPFMEYSPANNSNPFWFTTILSMPDRGIAIEPALDASDRFCSDISVRPLLKTPIVTFTGSSTISVVGQNQMTLMLFPAYSAGKDTTPVAASYDTCAVTSWLPFKRTQNRRVSVLTATLPGYLLAAMMMPESFADASA